MRAYRFCILLGLPTRMERDWISKCALIPLFQMLAFERRSLGGIFSGWLVVPRYLLMFVGESLVILRAKA